MSQSGSFKTSLVLSLFIAFAGVAPRAANAEPTPEVTSADESADAAALAKLSNGSNGAGGSSGSDGWTFRLAPYGWLSPISGKVGLKGFDTQIHLGMSDVIDHVDGGAMLLFEARHDRWSINTDLIWAQLSGDAATPLQTFFTNAKLTLNEIIWTEALGYTVIKDEDVSLDLLAGFRLFYMDTDLELTGGATPDGRPVESIDPSLSKTWVDPIIGVRSNIRLDDTWFVIATGDVGGFGANSSSTWQALTALGYNICDKGSIGVGYRAMNYVHDRDGFKYNAIAYGPFIGGEFRF